LAFICINPGFFVGNNREVYSWKKPAITLLHHLILVGQKDLGDFKGCINKQALSCRNNQVNCCPLVSATVQMNQPNRAIRK